MVKIQYKHVVIALLLSILAAAMVAIVYDVYTDNVPVTVQVEIQVINNEQGANCTIARLGEIVAIDCNYDEWNAKTNFGQYPIVEPSTDIETESEIIWRTEIEDENY